MRETGADKKTAMDHLRKCQWNYQQAKIWWYMPEALSNLSDAIKRLTEQVAEAIQKVDWDEAVKKIKEERGDQK